MLGFGFFGEFRSLNLWHPVSAIYSLALKFSTYLSLSSTSLLVAVFLLIGIRGTLKMLDMLDMLNVVDIVMVLMLLILLMMLLVILSIL